ncbi:uncharacterized protein O3C94_020442 [Discoglossus pictus]
MEKKTIRVDGIPEDLPAERARDKLFIHFLRQRNGGGEVEKLEILHGPPSYALVTFEEAKVAQRVLGVNGHTLNIHGKCYSLKVTEVSDKLGPDEIFQKSSITVNYKQFPERFKNTMKSLSKVHTDVFFNFDYKQKICVISGPYTKVQAVIQEILHLLDIDGEGSKNDSPEIQGIAHDGQLARCKYGAASPQEPKNSAQMEIKTQESDYARADVKSNISKMEPTELIEEPFVWDSDIYKYIQKCYNNEYQHILHKHNVQAVDVSSEGITTLYLQAGNNSYQNRIDLMDARFDLLNLYQDLELKLRKEQISKREIKCDREFSITLFRDLQKVCPMLLCHEDDRYLYFIGSAVDVAQAKQYINDIVGQHNIDKSLKTPDPFPSMNMEIKQRKSKPMGSVEHKHHSYRHASTEAKGENKIAAKFNTPKSHSSTQQMSLEAEKYIEQVNTEKQRQEEYGKHQKPEMKVQTTQSYLSEKYLSKNNVNEAPQENETSGDKTVAFLRRREVIPSLNTEKLEIRQNTGTARSLGPVKPLPLFKGSSEMQYSSLLDINSYSTEYKMPEAKPTFRRSNSFSRVYSKGNFESHQQSNTLQGTSKDSTMETTVDIVTDMIYVDQFIWAYLKDIYQSDIEYLCSGVIVSEEQSREVTILILKATSRSTVFFAKEKIASFYNKMKDSLILHSLSYEMLELEGPDDKALGILHRFFQSCSNKLRIRMEKDKIHLTYPKEIQSKVQEEYVRFLEYKRKSPSLSSMIMETSSHLSKGNLDKNDENHELDAPDSSTHGTDLQTLSRNAYHVHTSETTSSNMGAQDVPFPTSQRKKDLGEQEDQKKSFLRDTSTSADTDNESAKLFTYSKDNSNPEDLLYGKDSDTIVEDTTLTKREDFKDLGNVKDGNFESEDKKFAGAVNESTFFKKLLSPSCDSSPHDMSTSYPQELQHFNSVEQFFEDPDPQRAKNVLPNRFHLNKSRTKDDLDEHTRSLSSDLHLYETDYKSLPVRINSTAQNVKEKVHLKPKEVVEDVTMEGQFLNKSQSNQEQCSSSKIRSPAVGQEAEESKELCDECKKDSFTIKASCGHFLCGSCVSREAGKCLVCLDGRREDAKPVLKVNMIHKKMSLSLPGYDRYPSIKIIYEVPDGVQGVGHPHPGNLYQGKRFEAYLPDNLEGQRLLRLLEKALQQGLTFKIQPMEDKDIVTWNCIPHKTSPDGGKIKNGYPDSYYLKSLTWQLKEHGLE